MAKKQVISQKKQQIEKANSTLLISLAIASAVLSISLVFAKILWEQGRFNARVINAQEQVRDDINSNLEAIPDLQRELVVFEGANDIIGNQGSKKNSTIVLDALPSKFDFPAIATSFSGLADKANVKLTTFSGDDLGDQAVDSEPTPSPVDIPVKVGVRGNYNSVVRFLNSLERSIRPLVVDGFEISGSNNDLEVVLDITTYYQPAVDLEVKTKAVE